MKGLYLITRSISCWAAVEYNRGIFPRKWGAKAAMLGEIYWPLILVFLHVCFVQCWRRSITVAYFPSNAWINNIVHLSALCTIWDCAILESWPSLSLSLSPSLSLSVSLSLCLSLSLSLSLSVSLCLCLSVCAERTKRLQHSKQPRSISISRNTACMEQTHIWSCDWMNNSWGSLPSLTILWELNSANKHKNTIFHILSIWNLPSSNLDR